MKKILALVLALTMVLSLTLAQAETVAELPRNETLYFAGQQWGTVNNWNPLSSDSNNAMALSASASGSRTIMFETLYMYNFLDGSMVPLLASAAPEWNEANTEITVKLNPAAKWSDGTALTAQDVVYT
jgi:ABC-type dipeptide transport system, periplasmic component